MNLKNSIQIISNCKRILYNSITNPFFLKESYNISSNIVFIVYL